MKIKGKVYPLNTSSPSSSLSVLQLLPAAILIPVTILPIEDREVLAYMIIRSLKSAIDEDNKQCGGAHNSPALFDCNCFNCYTSFWLRWDSSPNRDLIHQAIESFEDHLNSKNAKTKRRDRFGHRNTGQLTANAYSESPGNQERDVSAAPQEVEEELPLPAEVDEAKDDSAVVARSMMYKGLVRKVLPDLMGIFHSRYWNLWSPNA